MGIIQKYVKNVPPELSKLYCISIASMEKSVFFIGLCANLRENLQLLYVIWYKNIWIFVNRYLDRHFYQIPGEFSIFQDVFQEVRQYFLYHMSLNYVYFNVFQMIFRGIFQSFPGGIFSMNLYIPISLFTFRWAVTCIPGIYSIEYELCDRQGGKKFPWNIVKNCVKNVFFLLILRVFCKIKTKISI